MQLPNKLCAIVVRLKSEMLSNPIQMDTEISSSIKAKLDLQDEIAYVNETINSKSETLAQIINAVGTDLDSEKQRSQDKDMVLMNQVRMTQPFSLNCLTKLFYFASIVHINVSTH